MGFLFNRPEPQQAVPRDLRQFRQNQIGQAGGYADIVGGLARGGQNDLQRLGSNSMGQFLRQPAPEQRALEISLPALQAQLTGTPGAQVLDPLQAISSRNLNDQLQQLNASAPGRFGSAIFEQQGRLRERSMQDFNLLASQILEQGLQRQLQAAGTLGTLSSQAGQQPFQRAATATGLGQSQQMLQLQALMALLGPILGPTFGGSFTQDPSNLEQIASLIGAISQGARAFGGGGQSGGGQSGSSR